MLTQQSPESEPARQPDPDFAAPDPAHAVYRYAVTSAVEVSVLARVVEMFTLRDLIPAAVSCRHVGRDEPQLRIDVEVAGLDPQHAEHLALRMRNLMPVTNVLLEVGQHPL